MASLSDVIDDQERTNWLKAWLAVDIAKSGLEHFAENEAKTVHTGIYNTVWSSVNAPAACIGCFTENLLKCPSPRLCNKRGASSICTSLHNTAAKQPRPCPFRICDKVLDEIKMKHRYSNPSWRNTSANHWASNPWQIATCYLPPDGYAGKSSVQDTDFNGIISFMINCTHFVNQFSFPIDPVKGIPSCLLTKAREIGKTVRNSSGCKVTDTYLHDIFKTLNSLLVDPTCLAHDVAAQEAVRKLAKLQTDSWEITTEEMNQTLKANYEQSCEDLRERLMEYYNDTSSNVPLSSLDQSLDKRITDIYATPGYIKSI